MHDRVKREKATKRMTSAHVTADETQHDLSSYLFLQHNFNLLFTDNHFI